MVSVSLGEEPHQVSFNFHVDEHGDGPHHDKEHMQYVTKEHTDKVEERCLPALPKRCWECAILPATLGCVRSW